MGTPSFTQTDHTAQIAACSVGVGVGLGAMGRRIRDSPEGFTGSGQAGSAAFFVLAAGRESENGCCRGWSRPRGCGIFGAVEARTVALAPLSSGAFFDVGGANPLMPRVYRCTALIKSLQGVPGD